MEGAAGLYRDRAVWIFPVPDIPEGKHEQAMCNRIFYFRREHERESVEGLRAYIGFGGMVFSCSGDSGGESKSKYVAGGDPFGGNMTVNSWRVLRDYIGIVRYGFFLFRIFRRGSMNE